MQTYPLKEYFVKYLKDVQNHSDSSIKHYLHAISWVSRYFVQKGLVKESLFEVMDEEELERLKTILYADPEFTNLNKRGNRMYSAGFNHYLRFAKAEQFDQIGAKTVVLDIPMPVPRIVMYTEEDRWRRSQIIKKQSLTMAQYKCEIDESHTTFVMEGTGMPFMEGHHIIPMKCQDQFGISLDVYSNILCLCTICHRFLHYGRAGDKKPILSQVYASRSDRMAHSGIRLSHDEFVGLLA